MEINSLVIPVCRHEMSCLVAVRHVTTITGKTDDSSHLSQMWDSILYYNVPHPSRMWYTTHLMWRATWVSVATRIPIETDWAVAHGSHFEHYKQGAIAPTDSWHWGKRCSTTCWTKVFSGRLHVQQTPTSIKAIRTWIWQVSQQKYLRGYDTFCNKNTYEGMTVSRFATSSCETYQTHLLAT